MVDLGGAGVEGDLGLHHVVQPREQLHSCRVVEGDACRSGLASVAVVDKRVTGFGKPVLDEPRVGPDRDPVLGRTALHDPAGVGLHGVERRGRSVGVESRARERGLVVVEQRVRVVERHWPQHALDAVVREHAWDVVGGVRMIGLQARLRREHGVRVEQGLQRRILALEQVG